MISPRIKFHRVTSRHLFYKIRSSNEAILFRVFERQTGRGVFTLLDADWFNTNLELAPTTWEIISAYCEGRASEWGGGKSCLVIHAHPEQAAKIQRLLSRLLNDPASWLRWDREAGEFLPLQAMEAAA